jgi:ribonuclease HI
MGFLMDFKTFWDDRFSRYDFVVASDGGWNPAIDVAGWYSLVLGLDGDVVELGGTESKVNHMRMELLAALRGIEQTPPGSDILVITDSAYVQNIVGSWMYLWESKGWKSSTKNLDIIQRLFEICTERSVDVEWVKAHTNIDSGLNNLNRYVDGQVTEIMQKEIVNRGKVRTATELLLERRAGNY